MDCSALGNSGAIAAMEKAREHPDELNIYDMCSIALGVNKVLGIWKGIGIEAVHQDLDSLLQMEQRNKVGTHMETQEELRKAKKNSLVAPKILAQAQVDALKAPMNLPTDPRFGQSQASTREAETPQHRKGASSHAVSPYRLPPLHTWLEESSQAQDI
jgi:hypothetical protein